jgi:hypothetical protein
MNSKSSNYHFGRHVFEYFPWYSYDEKTDALPKLDNDIWTDFIHSFDDKLGDMILVWSKNIIIHPDTFGICTSFNRYTETIIVNEGIARYKGIEEEVFDWEDIEKIRLRNILGTKEKADRYFKTIEFYNKYHWVVSDAIYTITGIDDKVPLFGINDFIHRGNTDICMEFIEDEDVYFVLQKYSQSGGNMYDTKFLKSTYSQYEKNGCLSNKQISILKGILYGVILSDVLSKKNLVFFRVDNMPSGDGIIKYFNLKGLKVKKFDDYALVY